MFYNKIIAFIYNLFYPLMKFNPPFAAWVCLWWISPKSNEAQNNWKSQKAKFYSLTRSTENKSTFMLFFIWAHCHYNGLGERYLKRSHLCPLCCRHVGRCGEKVFLKDGICAQKLLNISFLVILNVSDTLT